MGNGQGRGTLILVLGILGLVSGCLPCGIAAWIMGSGDMKKIAAGQIPESERGMTQTGMILGIVSVVLAIVGFVIGILFLCLGVAAAGAGVQ
ncbi:MAG: hypothetical protein FJ276_03395 [Planctomycetes bacterium]|nr:hypothetical protein [Planctomycetota bacterium]